MRMWKDSLPAVLTRCLLGRIELAYTIAWNRNERADGLGRVDVLVGTDPCGFQCFGTELFVFVRD